MPRLSALSGAALVACLAGCSTPPAPVVQRGPSIYQSQTKPGATLDRQAAAAMISEFRRSNGYQPVRLDPALNRMADEQATAMARADKLSHSAGASFKERIARSGYRNGGMVENIGAGHDTLADAFAGWRASPVHMKNMLMPKAGAIGIAAVRAPHSRYEVYWAMVMADPNDPRPIVTAAVASPPPPDAPAPGTSTLTVNGVTMPGR